MKDNKQKLKMAFVFVLGVLFGMLVVQIMIVLGIHEFLKYFQVETIILNLNETEVAEAVFKIAEQNFNASGS